MYPSKDQENKTIPALHQQALARLLVDSAITGNRLGVTTALAAGADIGAKPSGYTALHAACANGQAEIVRLLLGHGANIEAKEDRWGETPLHFAAQTETIASAFTGFKKAETANYLEVAKALVQFGADLEAKNNGGDTPFIGAAANGCQEMAAFLMEAGADCNYNGSRSGKTPLQYAKERNPAVAQFLAGQIEHFVVSKPLAGIKESFVVIALPENRFATGSHDHFVRVWSPEKLCVKTLPGHTGYISALAVLPSGHLVSASADSTIKIWDIAKGECIQTLKGHQGFIFKLLVLPNGDLASCGGGASGQKPSDTKIRVWAVKEGKCLLELQPYGGNTTALGHLQGGRQLISGNTSGDIEIWDLASKARVKHIKANGAFYGFAVLPDGKTVIAGSSNENAANTLVAIDTAAGEVVKKFRDFPVAIRGIHQVSEHVIVFPDTHKRANILDVRNGNIVSFDTGHADKWLGSVALLTDGTLATCLSQGQPMLHERYPGKALIALDQQASVDPMTDYLAKNNVDVNGQADQGFLALVASYVPSGLEDASYYQSQIADLVKGASSYSVPYLSVCAAAGNLKATTQAVRMAEENGRLNLEAKDHWQNTAFSHAVQYGRYQVAAFLITKGASVEVVTRGLTLLMWAAHTLKGNKDAIETAKVLLKAGANALAKANRPDVPECHQCNFLEIAKNNGHDGFLRAVIPFLDKAKNGLSAQEAAAQYNIDLTKPVDFMGLIGNAKASEAAKEEAKPVVPVDYYCPITHQIMLDPVIASDGETYEREAIQAYFQRCKQGQIAPIVAKDAGKPAAPATSGNRPGAGNLAITSPVNGTEMNETLFPNNRTRSNIKEFLVRWPQCWGDVYRSTTLAESCAQCALTGDVAQLNKLLQQDLRLLYLPLRDDGPKTLIDFACQRPHGEMLKFVIAQLKQAGRYVFSVEKLVAWLVGLPEGQEAHAEAIVAACELSRAETAVLFSFLIKQKQARLVKIFVEKNLAEAHQFPALVEFCLERLTKGDRSFAESEKILALVRRHPKAFLFIMELVRQANMGNLALLLEKGIFAFNDKLDEGGNTCLHLAVQHGQAEMAQWLVGQGADTKAANFSGQTAEQIARGQGNDGLARGLRQWRQDQKVAPLLALIKKQDAEVNQLKEANALQRAQLEKITKVEETESQAMQEKIEKIQHWQSQAFSFFQKNLQMKSTGYALQSTLVGHSAEIISVAQLQDGSIITASFDSTLKIWNLTANECRATLVGHSGHVNSVTQTADGRIVSGSSDHTLKVWDKNGQQCLATLAGHTAPVRCMALLKDGRIVSGSKDGMLKIWELGAYQCVATYLGHRDLVSCVIQLADGRVASCSEDATIKIWDLSTGKEVAALQGHSKGIFCLAQLRNGRLVSSAYDATLKIWDVATCQLVTTFADNSGTLTGIAELQNGHIAYGSTKNLRIWDTGANQIVSTLAGHERCINCVIELEDGRVVTGADDKTLKIWRPPNYVLEIPCDQVAEMRKTSDCILS